ncbi:MAG: alpha/beta hydrolase [Capsulimonadaceae bacterium]|nr:alpha/beta hydrolase [Capsulimonadaceae bacterium]
MTDLTHRAVRTALPAALALILLAWCVPARAYAPPAEEGNVKVDGVQVHYKLQGAGDAIVFVHGLARNYQIWDSYVAGFSDKYRVLSYSRRYDWPNHNKFSVPKDALDKEVDDLYWLIRAKRLGRVHIVGESYGALIALTFAARHQEMVRSLELVEPPIVRWLLDSPSTNEDWTDFLNKAYVPAKREVLDGREEQALKTFDDWLEPGYFNTLASQDLDAVFRSSDDLKAVLLATGGFPTVTHSDMSKLTVPVLLISGEKSPAVFSTIQKQLAIDLGGAPIVTIAGAGHNAVTEQPEAVRTAIAEFLAQHARR